MPGRALLIAGLATMAALTASCANIPDESTPQAVANGGGNAAGAIAPPDPLANPLDLVRGFVGQAGNPDAARTYLTDSAKQTWQGDAPPTIIADGFSTVPLPAREAKAQGDEQPNEATVVLTVTELGRIGSDRAFIPGKGDMLRYDVVVRRQNVGDPWRIEKPPPTVLITQPDFNRSYQQVSIYFFDPEYRVLVPDLRYIAALPLVGVPDRVMRLLLDGPSDTVRGAVRTQLADEAEMRTNAVINSDGALEVNLTKIGDRTPEDRALIAAQIVMSLRDVTQSKIRLLVDNHPLVTGHSDWRPVDLPSYDAPTKPDADLPGLFTSNGRVYALRDGNQVAGPAGNGELKVQSAAQSMDGKTLAVVTDGPGGARLRIGPFGGNLAEVDLQPSTLTRPTWLLGTLTAPSNEVWTVQNGVDVVRVVRTGSGSWVPAAVNTSELKSFGTITDLRLSRDGVRLAVVANGQVVVASVVRDKESVTIRSPRTLQIAEIKNAVSVDWRSQDTVAVATGQSDQPVVNIRVDGFGIEPYSRANLGIPVSAIAAAPDRDILVTDHSGIWRANGIGQVWQLFRQIPDARPFYPG